MTDPYREIFEHMGVALFVHDTGTGNLLLANPAACKLYGIAVDGAKAAWPSLLVDERQMVVDPSEAILQAQHGPEVAVEWPARRVDDSTFWASLRFQRGQLGARDVVLVEIHDVSTRRSAVRALAASERDLEETHRMLRSVLDAIPTRVFWKDLNSRYLGCNTTFAKDAGIAQPRDVAGLDDFALPWQDAADHYQGHDESVTSTGEVQLGLEGARTCADGVRMWVRTNKVPLRDAKDQIIGVLGTYEDISQSKAAEVALREREEDLQITLNSIGDGVISTDNQGRVRRMNPVAERLTGWAQADALGRALHEVFELVDAELDTCVHDPIARARSGGSVDLTQHIRLRSKDGHQRRIVDSGAEIRDTHGEVRGVVVAFRDISESHALQEQLHHAKQMEVVGTLAGGVAHDFNNLLQVVLGCTSLVLEDLPESDPNADLLEDVLESAERASTLTRQLLTFSRSESIRLRGLEINEVVGGVQPLLKRVLGELIELRLTLGSELPVVRADAHQLDLALLSLCLNARAQMAEGGVVRLFTYGRSLDEKQAALFHGARSGHYVVVAVQDEGPGVAQTDVAHIFEPFYSVNPEGQGNGLGLASVDAVAQTHGGFVQLKSQPEVGTRFELHLPVIEPSQPPRATAPQSDSTRPRPGQPKILFAEDVESLRKLGARVLRRAGHTVVEASDGQEAEDLFLAEPEAFDAVVLDVVMPKKGGQEVYRTIKEVRPGLPVLFSSGYSITRIEPEMSSERRHLLQKPYLPATLIAKIEELLR